MEVEMEEKKTKIPVRTAVGAIVALLMQFLPVLISGKWDWWQGWVLGVVTIFFAVISRVLAIRKNPDLLKERSEYAKAEGAKEWDRRLVPVITIYLPLLAYIIFGLDKRFAWTQPFSRWVGWLGLALLLFGFAFSTWAMVENRFYATVVRIQTDRGHQVVQSGPYRIMRHPGYAGGILGYLAMPLFINSLWGLLPMLATCILTILRTYLEDKTLQSELPGYAEYAQCTRYRLLPSIW